MNFIAAIFTAIAEFFRFKTKTTRTPDQDEIQKARAEGEIQKDGVRAWVHCGPLPASLRDDPHGVDPPQRPGGPVDAPP